MSSEPESRPRRRRLLLLLIPVAAGVVAVIALLLMTSGDGNSDDIAASSASPSPMRTPAADASSNTPAATATPESRPMPPFRVEDNVFALTGWSIRTFLTQRTASNATQILGADPFLRMDYQWFGDPDRERARLGVIYELAGTSYDPAEEGALDRIDFSALVRIHTINFENSQGRIGHAFVIFQGGEFYHAAYASYGERDWLEVSASGLTAEDFHAGSGLDLAADNPMLGATGAHPNFSADAAPIRFGFLKYAWNRSTVELRIEHDIDAWSATVHRAE